MYEQAVLNHAAKVLMAAANEGRADLALRGYLGGGHASWRELREITGSVFAYFRWIRWLDPKESPQRRLAQAVLLQERFDQDEKKVKAETLAARAVPEWLHQEMEVKPEFLRQLQREPSLWLRARPDTRDSLAKKLGGCETTAHAPDALRYRGDRDLFQTPEFKAGAFEIQDLASQKVGVACAPHPGETWWDACAGEGGKTLHLCDLMGNKGRVWATDRNQRRLAVLKRRASRAKLFNVRTASWNGETKPPGGTHFDGVLVDAPCSGVGTWQRNPDARWTTAHEDVPELAAIQGRMLGHACGSVRPGGRLVYSVCTLTRLETSAVAEVFTAAHPEFVFQSSDMLWPQDLDSNGMFIAVWNRARS